MASPSLSDRFSPTASGISTAILLYKYQGIYMFCGLLTVAYSCVLLSWIPDGPMKPKYLNERERFIAVQRLRANQMGIQPEQSNGSVSTFGNLIIRDFGYTNFQSIFFKSSFGVIQIVCIVGSVWGAVLGSRKGLAIAMVAILPIVGTIIMLTFLHQLKGVLLLGYYLVSYLAAVTPLIYAWHV
ncbi:hypothetical protein PSV08DRAFT_356963 [Bipolaris maydis]|uniref:uncharacterized protein n=1 Tax=Cochliobolus heterostrophus TaxID=5016 RepID=UPI0024CFD726|nr:hypothetical protein J3E73DRAFT_375630 [Bipolaris maydis]KAJ6265910.1 hypothetical protein PSV08DRAFT_356963 [Bipolaris maydis]KAJ6276713.1 hypothetical protein J3E71DRAFT_347688 [Bipolaris maydis]